MSEVRQIVNMEKLKLIFTRKGKADKVETIHHFKGSISGRNVVTKIF